MLRYCLPRTGPQPVLPLSANELCQAGHTVWLHHCVFSQNTPRLALFSPMLLRPDGGSRSNIPKVTRLFSGNWASLLESSDFVPFLPACVTLTSSRGHVPKDQFSWFEIRNGKFQGDLFLYRVSWITLLKISWRILTQCNPHHAILKNPQMEVLPGGSSPSSLAP